ncbi:hypothetical protein [Streptomyces sp.]|uniref:hypothetical protein n=1 Tax=Streptomyces sp. TaxID=1931 RepID=UPI002D78F2D1|nr:hypothetical protein [Streptomyces sp.]HET6358796.1 hypothetical protein [Streptomyces sp.]
MIAVSLVSRVKKEHLISAASAAICSGIPAAVGGALGGPPGAAAGVAVGAAAQSLARGVVEEWLTEAVDGVIETYADAVAFCEFMANAPDYAKLAAVRKLKKVCAGLEDGPRKELCQLAIEGIKVGD